MTTLTSDVHDLFGLENDTEAWRLLDLIDAEFRSDPQSVVCFDARIVERVKQCIEQRKLAERKGDVPPLLTEGKPELWEEGVEAVMGGAHRHMKAQAPRDPQEEP